MYSNCINIYFYILNNIQQILVDVKNNIIQNKH